MTFFFLSPLCPLNVKSAQSLDVGICAAIRLVEQHEDVSMLSPLLEEANIYCLNRPCHGIYVEWRLLKDVSIFLILDKIGYILR